jgi:hypothetical protein
MKRERTALRGMLIHVLIVVFVVMSLDSHAQTINYSAAKQGYSMKLEFNNMGGFGRIGYPPYRVTPNPPAAESLGLEYPVGQLIEHVYGGGIWIGGILDTSRTGTSPPLRLLSLAYEGWAGPYYELFPGSQQADSIWRVYGRNAPKPSGWDAYWSGALAFRPMADQNFYCNYRDSSNVEVAQHVPLNVRVIQSSFAWNDPYAEGIHIIEYKIMNMGRKTIDSSYLGFFLEGDVGPISIPSFYQHNYSGYLASTRAAYSHNPIDIGSTPVGISILDASRPLNSLRTTFHWFPGPQTPTPDVQRYIAMSTGVIDSTQSVISDTRFILACGPFTIRPGPSNSDTIVFAVAVLSAQSISVLNTRATRAREIYLNHGLPNSVAPIGAGVPDEYVLQQNYPNPFNPTTTIEFSLPKNGHTTLKVYDVLGREVATIVDENLVPGKYKIAWSASQEASGVYVCRLVSGHYATSLRMILLK